MSCNPGKPESRCAILSGLGGAAAALAFFRITPFPAAEAVLAIFLLGTLFKTRWRLPASGIIPFLLCVAASFSLAGNCSFSAVREIAQLAAFLFFGVAAFRSGGVGKTILGGITGAWLACTGIALHQLFSGHSASAIGGSLGARAIFGLTVAATLPLVLAFFSFFLSEGRMRVAASLVLLAGAFSIFYFPALIIFCAAAIGWAAACASGNLRTHVAVLAAFIIPVIMLSGGMEKRREALLSGVALRDAGGMTRRWVLEARASLAAIGDSPLAGHGPGKYQSVVSSGKYRRFLPETAENKIESGTQCGYLVLAVEFGLPVAFLFLLLLIVAAVRSCGVSPRDNPGACESRSARALGICLLMMAVGMAFTNFLVQGTGVLVACAVGLAASFTQVSPGEISRLPWRRTLVFQALILCVIGGLVVAVSSRLSSSGKATSEAERQSHLFPKGCSKILLEAEAAVNEKAYVVGKDDPYASGKKAAAVPDVEKYRLRSSPGADHKFRIEKSGNYRLWVRAFWDDGCSNSVAVKINESETALIGNDGTYRVWHWVPGPMFNLPKGEHTLAVFPREPNIMLDQILLIDAEDYYPSGILDANGEVKTVSAGDARVGVWPCEGRLEKKKFLAAVGGMYQPGPESFFVQLGIPYERLRDDEMTSYEILKQYDLIWLSNPKNRTDEVWKAVHAFVKNGGAAILEKMGENDVVGRYPYTEEERELIPVGRLSDIRSSKPGNGRSVTVRIDGSKYFEDIPDNSQVLEDVLVCGLQKLPENVGESHGEILYRGKSLGVVFTKRVFGKGTLYALGMPVGNSSMWRGTRFDPLGKEIVLDAIAGRYTPIYKDLSWRLPPGQGVHFSDDFMRSPGEGKNWAVESGKFSLTGAPPSPPPRYYGGNYRPRGPKNPFSLKGFETGYAVCGNPNWRSYRVSMAVNADEGEGGLWLSTSSGRRLMLTYSGESGRLKLAEKKGDGGKVNILGAVPVPGTTKGWRRISLMRLGVEWQGRIDGVRRISIPAGDEDSLGQFGVAHSGGVAYYDDIHVRSVSSLVPGTDLCVGEEGSCDSQLPIRAGIEPRTVYARQWPLRADPLGRHAALGILPLYEGGRFYFDGKLLGSLEPTPAEPLIYFPENEFPKYSVQIETAFWKDYNFSGQTVDWYSSGKEWDRISRWSCDQKWEWLGVAKSPVQSILWHRMKFKPPYSFLAICGQSMGTSHSFSEKDRDLNLVVGGNGEDLKNAFVIKTGPAGGDGCRLFKDGKMLAQGKAFGLPPGGGITLHHRWIMLEVKVDADRIRFYYEGKLALDHRLSSPVKLGQLGIWTQNNAMQVARATISYGKE